MQYLQDRIDTLEKISGLKVKIYRDKNKNENVFEFFADEEYEKPIKACFTYHKAKLFAEGVQYGKECH